MSSKRGRGVKKCVKWGKRLASTDILLIANKSFFVGMSKNFIRYIPAQMIPHYDKLKIGLSYCMSTHRTILWFFLISTQKLMREYLKAREELLGFFLRYMYSNNVTKFNLVNNFPNDAERMRHFIDRFNKYFPDETFEYMITSRRCFNLRNLGIMWMIGRYTP